jgi:serine phosphatase RsbU (regulator of sigma subunit)
MKGVRTTLSFRVWMVPLKPDAVTILSQVQARRHSGPERSACVIFATFFSSPPFPAYSGEAMRHWKANVRIPEVCSPAPEVRTRETRILLLGSPETDAGLWEAEIARLQPQACLLKALDPGLFASALEENTLTLVLLDHHPPRTDAAKTLRLARDRHPEVPFIILSHSESDDAAESLLRAGATDFLPRTHLQRLGPTLARSLREGELRQELEQTRQNLRNCNLQLETMMRNAALELFLKNEAMEEELRLSQKIHHALLPKRIPPIAGPLKDPKAPGPRSVRFASLYRPATVQGGDFFHLGRSTDKTVNLFIGDVMGHGVRATLVSTMLRVLDQTLNSDTMAPDRLLHCMNQTLCNLAEDADLLVFATGCALTLDLQNATLLFANAGHPPPVCLPARGSCPVFLGTRGPRHPALGIFRDATFTLQTQTLEENDKVLLYTDGIFQVENKTGSCLGPGVLEQELRGRIRLPLQTLLDSLLSFLTSYSESVSFADDICMLGLELNASPPHAA